MELLALLALGAAWSAPQEAPEQEFRQELRRARESYARQEHDRAYQLVLDLVAAHAGQPYLIAEAPFVAELVKRCAYWRQHPEIEADSLTSGEVTVNDAARGILEVRYGKDDLDDFTRLVTERSRQSWYLHPVTFDGRYYIEIRGDAYPANDLAAPLFVLAGHEVRDLELQQYYVVAPGLKGISHKTSEVTAVVGSVTKDGVLDPIERDESPAEIGERFRIKVLVDRNQVRLFFNQRPILRVRKPKDLLGRIGFANLEMDDTTEIIIHGNVRDAWLANRASAAEEERLARFDASFQLDEHIDPSDLLPGARSLPPLDPYERVLPGTPGKQDWRAIERAWQYMEANQFEAGLDWVRELSGNDVAEDTRDYLVGLFLEKSGDLDGALKHLLRVAERDPEFLPARLGAARLLREFRRTLVAYETLRCDFPALTEPYEVLAAEYLFANDRRLAAAVLGDALNLGLDSEPLREFGAMMANLELGPNWRRADSAESKHYRVHSDQRRADCERALDVLEAALDVYESVHGQPPAAETDKATVYLFSGRSGFLAYTAGAWSSPHEGALGVYHMAFKQLLVWDSLEEESWERTLRHEGFHQYLDRFPGEPPTWLNEGLAEYYETACVKRGRVVSGELVRAHLAWLQSPKAERIPLAELLDSEPQAFHANPVPYYAESWALVHFLRHGAPKGPAILERMFEALRDGAPRQRVVRLGFEGVDRATLESEYRRYVRGLD